VPQRFTTPYQPEYKSEAVRLVQSGVKIVQVVKDLGGHDQTIPNWTKQADLDIGRRGVLERLLRLARAAAFFAALYDAELTEIIRKIDVDSRGTYGVPRVECEVINRNRWATHARQRSQSSTSSRLLQPPRTLGLRPAVAGGV
jgi:transposase-like protein